MADTKIVDTGFSPIKFAIDWERKCLMVGVVVKNEIGEYHTGGYDLPWETAYELGSLLVKMSLDLKDGGDAAAMKPHHWAYVVSIYVASAALYAALLFAGRALLR